MRPSRFGLEIFAILIPVVLCFASCGDDGESPTASTPSVIVFNAENNRLDAYDPSDNFRKQVVDHNHSEDPNGRDINGQICFLPDGSRRFIAGEDTGQP
ncbi:MAG TPA: hypothetical protein VMT89_12860, partial [Candidatus Acidoferrales bacterium]|nr:hypothetical protein [Candidatus Acidoferrales bacterium]